MCECMCVENVNLDNGMLIFSKIKNIRLRSVNFMFYLRFHIVINNDPVGKHFNSFSRLLFIVDEPNRKFLFFPSARKICIFINLVPKF